MKLAYFPFYVSDWLGSRKVLLMTDAQRGIYITLLAHQWSDPSHSIPTEKTLLQKMLPGSKWKNIEYVIQECFVVQGTQGERARNERLSVEEAKAIGISEKAKYAVKCREDKKKQQSNDERTIIERSSCQNQNQIHIQKDLINIKQEDGSKKRFVRPTIEEIRSYCLERRNSVDPQKFFDHYESNGWRVGKNSMKSWQAAVRTWEKNDYEQTGTGIPEKGSGAKSFHQIDTEEALRVKAAVRSRLGFSGGSPGLDCQPNESEIDGGREDTGNDKAVSIFSRETSST